MSYYDRSNVVHLDGTSGFANAEDERAQREVAAEIGPLWNCELHRFTGRFQPVDWYAVRRGCMVAVAELKARSHKTSTYPTVFLNVRKWLALSLAQVGLGVPAVFVVRFTDALMWISLAKVDGTKIRIGGCKRIVKATNDIEPVIEVPIEKMRQV